MGSPDRFDTHMTDTEDDRERRYRRVLEEVSHFNKFESLCQKVDVEFFGPASE
jgi:hypothetical protein